ERMNIICQRFDALGKALRVRNDVSIPVAINLPAVIDDHVLITSILHARLHHRIGHPANHLVAHVAAEFIPTVPPHGRSECKIGRWSGVLREESSAGEYQNGRAQQACNRLHKLLLNMAVTFVPETKTSGKGSFNLHLRSLAGCSRSADALCLNPKHLKISVAEDLGLLLVMNGDETTSRGRRPRAVCIRMVARRHQSPTWSPFSTRKT